MSCVINEWVEGQWEEEEGLKWEPELVLGIIEACFAYTTPVSFLHVHSIGEHEQHNILNFELALFVWNIGFQLNSCH